jgi:hypothetical protein
MPDRVQFGTVEFPPGIDEFQHARFSSMGTGALVAHISDKVLLLSKERP